MGKLYMKEKVFSLGGHFAVKDEFEKDKYYVDGTFMKIPKQYTITNMTGNLVGTITKKMFSWLPRFFVDLPGRPTVTIVKELTFLKARYRIEGGDLTVEGDWWNKNFKILNADQVVAIVNEKWFTWGDTYEIEIFDNSQEAMVISLVVAIDVVKQDEEASSSTSASVN